MKTKQDLKGITLLQTNLQQCRKYLTEEQAGKILFSIYDYVYEDKEPDFNEKILSLCWDSIKVAIDNNIEKYIQRCLNGEKGKAYGKLGAEYGIEGGRGHKKEKVNEDKPIMKQEEENPVEMANNEEPNTIEEKQEEIVEYLKGKSNVNADFLIRDIKKFYNVDVTIDDLIKLNKLKYAKAI